MEETVTHPPEQAEVATVQGDAPMKEVRHRKKQFYKTLRQQMEFYFSDANLAKNRFMGMKVLENPNVELKSFLQFNKIRALTMSTQDIVKALRKSQTLAITEDGTKVYRTTPMRENDREDECTIYVELLPPDAELEWLRSIFLPYGNVPYISIPKYPTSKLNKGFAFVEFDTPESANRALEAFGAMGCRMSTQIHPEQLCSIASNEEFQAERTGAVEDVREKESEDIFPEEKPTDTGVVADKEAAEPDENCVPYKKRKKMHMVEDVQSCPKAESGVTTAEVRNEDEKEKLGKKRKTSSVGVEVKAKKRKVKEGLECGNDGTEQSEGMEIGGDKDVEGEESRKKKCGKSEVDDCAEKREENEGEAKRGEDVEQGAVENGEGKENGEEEKRKKKSRSHKKKTKKEDRDDPKLSLRVLPKTEWKRLRGKYLDLQKSKMMNLKQHLARSRWGSNYSQEPRDYYHYGSQRNEEPVEEKPAEEKPVVKPAKQFSFIPGVIVRVRLDEPVGDVQAFKASARTQPNILYVDVLEGTTEAHIRCASADAASRLASEGPWRSVQVLTGEEETQYWDKITRDRDEKISGVGRKKKGKRGREKLLEKAEKALGKHIRFDEHE